MFSNKFVHYLSGGFVTYTEGSEVSNKPTFKNFEGITPIPKRSSILTPKLKSYDFLLLFSKVFVGQGNTTWLGHNTQYLQSCTRNIYYS